MGGGAGLLDLAADGVGGDSIPHLVPRVAAHVAKAFKGRRRQLAKIGVERFYLPPCSPESNDIELVWRQTK